MASLQAAAPAPLRHPIPPPDLLQLWEEHGNIETHMETHMETQRIPEISTTFLKLLKYKNIMNHVCFGSCKSGNLELFWEGKDYVDV